MAGLLTCSVASAESSNLALVEGVVCGAQSQLAGGVGFPAGVATAAVAPWQEGQVSNGM